MTAVGGTRIALAVVAVAILGGSLTGCGHVALGGQQAPAAAVTPATTVPAPTPSGAGDDSSLSSIQADLDSANSATANAGGDVSDADSSAATNDSP